MSDERRPAWIDTADGVLTVAELCLASGEFALDTEADSMHSYFHKVCLIQVSVDNFHFLIDPLALEPSDLDPLWAATGEPSIPVLMHGADYDIRVLDRDYGARIAGLLDTQIMAQLLAEEKTGLGALLEKELGVTVDKKYQRADWGRRPLRSAQLAYAAADTAHLAGLKDRLCRRLDELGRWSWAVEDCRQLENVRHTPVETDEIAFERIKGARALRGAARDRLFTLYRWRDSRAQSMDVPPFKVLGNKPLMEMAIQPPSNLEELGEINGVGHRAVRRWGRDLLHHLRRPERAPDRVRAPRVPALPVDVRHRFKTLSAVRDTVAKEMGLQAGLVCPKACVETLASGATNGSVVADLQRLGLTGWRLEVLGDRFAAALSEE